MKKTIVALLVSLPILAETKVRSSITVGAPLNICDKIGPVCPSGVDDSAAFSAAEASASPEIYLPAGTFIVNGVALKKSYVGPGTIKLDGINRYRGWSVDRGRALGLDYQTRVRALGLWTDKASAVYRKDANTLLIYRPLGGPFWQEIQLLNTGTACSSNCPYSWNQTKIVQLMSYIALEPAAALVHSGTWNALDSGDPNLYIGGHAKWTDEASAGTEKIDYTFNGGGDLYVIFIGRTNGGYVQVDLDGTGGLGSQATALPLGGTGNYRYLDTYDSTDLTYKKARKVATGMASGAHTLTLTLKADKNAANVSGLSRFYFNGIGIIGKDQGLPSMANTRAPQWTTGVTYAAFDWVQNGGKSYYTVAGGVAGATAPTCSVGTCSDGTVTWTFAATSSYDLLSHTIQAPGSQLEYAFMHKPTGASTFQQCGGVEHGNEVLVSLNVDVDGQPLGDPAQGTWANGDTVTVSQQINERHPDTGVTNIASAVLVHRVQFDEVNVMHQHTWLVANQIGWFYTAMWPLFHWGVPAVTGEFRYAFDNLFTPQGGKSLATAYYGQVNPFVGKTPDFYMQASGPVLMPKGAAGVADPRPGIMTAVAGLYVSPESVNEYRNASSLFASKAMNIAGTTAPGFSSVVMKMYFERVPTSPTVAVVPGEIWQSNAIYDLTLVPVVPYDPTN